VADAAVVIAPSTGGPFDDESMRSPPTASVQLITQPDARLSPPTVSGVQRFVAAAYPGLSAQRVTVVDSGGFILSGMPAADHAASKESRVQTAIQTALDAVLGTGAAVVRVSARTSGTSESEQSTRVSPHGLLDAETGREHGTESGRAFDKEKTTRHFAYDTVVNHRSTTADSISRISVAVFLDARRVDTNKTAAITALVRAAAGADLRSGDEVVVQTLTFARRLEPAVRQSAGRLSTRLRAIVPAVALCIIVALGASIWPRVQELRLRPEPSEATDLSRQLAAERPHAAAYILRTLPTDLRRRVLDSWDARRRVAVQQILDDSRYA
jgi:flagellar biosynthesis/type III secretory pathway M-ring protein FliF/YscJ